MVKSKKAMNQIVEQKVLEENSFHNGILKEKLREIK